MRTLGEHLREHLGAFAGFMLAEIEVEDRRAATIGENLGAEGGTA